MKSPSLRFHEIDLLRGLACLSVLAFHFLSRGPRTGTMPGVDVPLADAVARYGYLGVHLFFVISGFVILMSAQGATPRSFVASRASRLYPAFWVGATVTAGAAWLLGATDFAVAPGAWLVNLTMVPHWFGVPYVDGAYWSLAVELHFYILVWLAIRLRLMGRLEWLLAGWLLVSALNALRPVWMVELWLVARWAPFFAAGGLFYLVRTQGRTPLRLALLAASFALALVYALFPDSAAHGSSAKAQVSQAVVALAVSAIFGVFWLIAAGRLRMRASPVVYYAGILTYPLYVTHQNLGFMLYGELHRSTGQVLLPLALMLATLFALSWCIHMYVELPLGRAMRRRLAAPRTAVPAALGEARASDESRPIG